ncbi:PDR/VanB family oxidoreductase [Parafrankia sp. EUN1f]|uniref:PDR/VanB family oxidoreductase n=1 Tax=Parafrankia sp. EUN1f TaxID=102897 RepID=UPI0001C46D3A|nr:PDR/VanB family oxidoreductase [Parafrankia sp. EUN1f]EFC80059.1 ferredoxin [Parafrankia sp. EUN1f]
MDHTQAEADLTLKVSRRVSAADRVAVIELRDPFGGDLPAWTPGAHIDLVLGPRLVRQYSLCGDPSNRSVWRIAVLREPDSRGGSEQLHTAAYENDLISVRGPRNHFLLDSAPRYLFIAGGIGITPIIPMITTVAAAGAEWELHYCGRSLASMAFHEELKSISPDRVELYSRDQPASIDLDGLLANPRPDTLVYCCGPESLLRAVEQRCAGWPEGALRTERFAPKEQGEPVRQGAFEVELAQSGVTLTVPEGTSILDALEAAGVQVLSSCQEGTCGTCETAVLSGEADHRDSLLTDAERAANNTMLICVSRAAGPRLVLDL